MKNCWVFVLFYLTVFTKKSSLGWISFFFFFWGFCSKWQHKVWKKKKRHKRCMEASEFGPKATFEYEEGIYASVRISSQRKSEQGVGQRRKWADGGWTESQQEVKARWFPHVVLAAVRISLPCTHTANRCCIYFSPDLPPFLLYLLLLHLRETSLRFKSCSIDVKGSCVWNWFLFLD